MSACLIAGGAGFLGSHLAEALVARGETVVIVDNFSHGVPENLAELRDRIEIIPGDLRSHTLVRRAMHGVERVFHFGVPWGLAVTGPFHAPAAGALGTWHLLLAARDAGCRRIVLASGGEVYGRSNRPIVDEFTHPNPGTPAAKEALMAEQEAVSFARSFGLGLVRLRFFNVFGPRQGPRAAGPNVRRIVESMLSGKRPVLYDHEIGVQDLLPVDEAIRATLLAADSDRSDGRIYNVAAGNSVQTLDLIKRLNLLLGADIPPLVAGPCSTAPPMALPDGTRARVELGFAAGFDLDERLQRCVGYYQNRGPAAGDEAGVLSLLASIDREPGSN